MGVGAQDDYEYALDFLDSTGVESADMLWDPTFDIWSSFGVRINSQMMLMTADLTAGTELFFGFSEEDRQEILETLPSLG